MTFPPNLKGELDVDHDFIWTDSAGRYHREDGPAIIASDNDEVWEYVIHGKWHREDGPAVSYSNGNVHWWINNKHLSKDEWLQYLKSGQSSLDQKTLNRIILENS
jgi:hypothetical protein